MNRFLVLRSPGPASSTNRCFADIREDRIYWTRLSEGYGSSDLPVITSGALSRQELCFKEAQAFIKQYGVDRVQCVATEAVRKAQNRTSFLKLGEKYGFKVRVLSGQEEARWTAYGALWGLRDLTPPPVVLDIGGASTEWGRWIPPGGPGRRAETSPQVAPGLSEGTTMFKSWPFGSVVLTERYISCFSPPPRGVFEKLSRCIQNTLKNCKDSRGMKSFFRTPPPCPLVATAGTATTLACLQYRTEDPYRVHGQILSFRQVQLWRRRLFALSEGERKALTGMPPQRANLILAGVSVLENVMCFFGWRECVISVTGLRFGLLSKKL